MPSNIEVKFRLRDPAGFRRRAAALADSHEVLTQEDTFFVVPHGRLKLRCFPDGAGQLIHYERPDEAGPKLSEYAVLPVQDAALIKPLLASLLGVGAVVEKEREIFLLGNVRVHLDSVHGLGNFLEFEAVFDDGEEGRGETEARKVKELMAKFGITDADLETGSYRELVTAPPN